MVRFLLQIWQTTATFVFVRLCTCSFGDLIFFQPGIVSVIQNSMLLGLSSVPWLQPQVLATNREHQTLDIFAYQRVNLFFLNACLSGYAVRPVVGAVAAAAGSGHA